MNAPHRPTPDSVATPLDIVVVEDHDDLRAVLVETLGDLGHAARGVGSAEACDALFAQARPDLVLLDIGLPGEDGFSLARRLRDADAALGIVMLSAHGDTRHRIAGYDSGADLYLGKPVATDELRAVLDALGRRLRPRPAPNATLRLNPVTLQLAGSRSTTDVSSQESQLLAALARAPGQRLSNAQLLATCGKRGELADPAVKSALEVQIVRLRKKLECAGAPAPTIKAIRGSGYQLCVPIAVAVPPAPTFGPSSLR